MRLSHKVGVAGLATPKALVKDLHIQTRWS
jgi:hypothetical protein